MSAFQKVFFAFIVCGSFIWQPQGLLAHKDIDKKFEAVNLGGDSSPTAPPENDMPPAYDNVVNSQEGQKQSWGEMFKEWGQKLKQSNPFRKKTATEKTIKKHRALKRQLKPRIESLETVLAEATTELANATEDQKRIGQKMKAADSAIKALDDDLLRVDTNVAKGERSVKKVLIKLIGQDPASKYRSAKENFFEAQRIFHGRQASYLNLRQTELEELVPKCRDMKKTLEDHLNSICNIKESPDKRYDGFDALKKEQYTQIDSDIKKSRELVSVTQENLREFNKLRKKFFKKCNEAVNAMGSTLHKVFVKLPQKGFNAARKKFAAIKQRFSSRTKPGGGGSSDIHISLTSTSPVVN
ncbi:MAG: hypothetical protein V6Z78_00135 [Holosporaceae bacterium]